MADRICGGEETVRMTLRNDTDDAPSCVWRAQGALLLIRLAGPIDLSAAGTLDTMLQQAGTGFRRVLVDLSDVTHFGRTGLAFLTSLTRTGATVQLTGSPDVVPLGQLLTAAGLDKAVLY
ncbi:STAS domain-containing protein [Cryptosporangium sp. NPDC048952]|uniref:STAS domain-containing protein n=1 Tax=Cryptosporangium sp. NPDC048952 TaxID=3363961 RepID=UPI003714417C